MTDGDKEAVEYLQLMILCVGFAAGAGILPYSKAEDILSWLLSFNKED